MPKEWPKLTCAVCQSYFRVKPYLAKRAKFCSSACFGLTRRGIIPKSAIKPGQQLSPSTQFKKGNVSYSKLHPECMERGPERYNWKGGKVSYSGLHYWIRRILGKPSFCEHCKKSGGNPRSYHWANKSGKYYRDTSDWLRLCVRCHMKYDQK